MPTPSSRDPFRKQDRPVAPARGRTVRLETGRITFVDNQRFTADVQPDGDPLLLRGLPFLFPTEQPDGAGLYFLPSIGARVVVLYDQWSATPSILCGHHADPEDYKGAKHDLRPGDGIWRSGSGAYLLLRRSGLGEWLSTPALRLALLPATNTFLVRAERLDTQTIGGRQEWTHDRQAGHTLYRGTYQDRADRAPQLVVGHGYHEDGALWQVTYDDPTIHRGTPPETRRKAFVAVGNLDDSGRRWELNIDDQSYQQRIGQADDGSVVYEQVQAREEPRTWQIECKKGRMDGDLMQWTASSDRQERLKLTIRDDGSLQCVLNGNTTLDIHPNGEVDLTCRKLRLGSPDADEPAVLGNVFREFLNGFINMYNNHVHMSNLGSPTSTVAATRGHQSSMDVNKLSNVTYTERQ